jgi:hypothetical protein
MRAYAGSSRLPNPSRRRARAASLAVFAASAASVHWACAATDSWTLANSGNWDTAANWSAGVPVAGNTVDITDDDSTARIVNYNYSGAAITLASLTVDNYGTVNNTLDMTTSVSLNANNEYFGDSGNNTDLGYGFMVQSDGTNSITLGGQLVLGNGTQDLGAYTLSGTGILSTGATATGGGETIGDNGTGTFVQTGGQNSVVTTSIDSTGLIDVGAGGTGLYSLSGGTVSCNGDLVVGFAGSGSFFQSGGTVSFSGSVAEMIFGFDTVGSGYYSLSAGTITGSQTENIGSAGNSTFVQSGGTHSAAAIALGGSPGITGYYTLSAGSLSAGGETIGQTGAGSFIQTGGTNTIGVDGLSIGAFAGSNGLYSLGAGTLTSTSQEVIGIQGNGTFVQTGGTNSSTGFLIVGDGSSSSATGAYQLEGGLLNSDGNMYVGFGSTATFTQYAGTCLVTGGLYLSSNVIPAQPGIFAITGGTASFTGGATIGGTSSENEGTLEVDGGSVTFDGIVTAYGYPYSSLYLNAGTLSVGGLNINGDSSALIWDGGTLDFLNGFTVDANSALGQFVTLSAGMTLSTGGTLNDNAQISLATGAGIVTNLLNIGGILNANGGSITSSALTVSSGGSFNLNSPLTNDTSITVGTGGGIYLNGENLTNTGIIQSQTGGLISGTGTLVNDAAGVISGAGNITTPITSSGTIEPLDGMLILTGALTNTGTISVPVGGEALVEDMPTNSATISLAGGQFSTNTATLHNTGQILGYGILTTGGLTNDSTLALAGDSSVYGSVTNTVNGLIHLSGVLPNVFYGPMTNRGQLTVDAGGNGTLYGAYTGAGPILDNGTLYVFANSVAGPISGTGVITIGSTSSGPAVVMLNTNSGLSTQDGLNLVAGSTLDITNNHFIINYGSGSDPIASIAGFIKSGYNGGFWNGTGIISSSAQLLTGGHAYGVGWADGADGVVSGLSSSQIEIKYTLLGDANLDGTVNGSDFSILASNFGKGFTNWDQGNFLFSSSINGSDFAALAANFGQGDSGAAVAVSQADIAALNSFAAANNLPIPTFGAVPEPATFGLLLVAGAGTFNRRRRRFSR